MTFACSDTCVAGSRRGVAKSLGALANSVQCQVAFVLGPRFHLGGGLRGLADLLVGGIDGYRRRLVTRTGGGDFSHPRVEGVEQAEVSLRAHGDQGPPQPGPVAAPRPLDETCPHASAHQLRRQLVQRLLVALGEHLGHQADAAHSAGEDTFTYGLLFQQEGDLAERCRRQLGDALRKLAKSVR